MNHASIFVHADSGAAVNHFPATDDRGEFVSLTFKEVRADVTRWENSRVTMEADFSESVHTALILSPEAARRLAERIMDSLPAVPGGSEEQEDEEGPCPECDGTGETFSEGPAVAGYNSAGAPFPEQSTRPCTACGGKAVAA